ncbi:hypothetical protein P9112_005563 [Eukaryota sp. TZLM1-RC]
MSRTPSEVDLTLKRRPSSIGQATLIVVSNRLPITLSYKDGVPQIKKSSGGLVTALTGTHLHDMIWLGWAGNTEPLTQQARDMVLAEGYVPIDCDPKYYELFYTGFANSVLWPLWYRHLSCADPSHYMSSTERPTFSPKLWQAYQHINQQFADAVIEHYTDDCLIWVHDYHLLTLPKMIRDKIPGCRIGLFFHIVWPSSEIFRTLPVRHDILEGMVACDVIGFHTFSYVRHFLSTCTRLLGATVGATVCKYKGRTTLVSAFPIGIDPQMFDVRHFEEEKAKQTFEELEKLRKRHKDKIVICGVDRLDYIKGIPFKLHGYRKFLQKYPEFRTKVVLIQVGVPTRENVFQYQELVSETNQLVGEIIGDHASLDWVPVYYVHSSVAFSELIALYTVSDVMMITSIRDGMNLVALEYCVTQKLNETPGVLVLSEFAGCSSSLSGAIRINPWDVDGTADAIYEALTMSKEDRIERHGLNYSFIAVSNTAEKWAENFLNVSLMFTSIKPIEKCVSLDLLSLASDYLESKRRLLLLDYDGTLVEFQRRPELAVPTKSLVDCLNVIASSPNSTLYIISGRKRTDLAQWFGDSSAIGLIAEHGTVFQPPDSSEWSPVHADEFNVDWMDEVLPIMENVQKSTPGSLIETKPASICFHYRTVTDRDFAQYQVRELHSNILDAIGSNTDVDFCFGNNVFEVRCKGADKGAAVQKIVSFHGYFDFIMCVGDDQTDEDMFSVFSKTKSESEVESEISLEADQSDVRVKRLLDQINETTVRPRAGSKGSIDAEYLPDKIYTILVGIREATLARYCLPDVAHVNKLVSTLSAMSGQGTPSGTPY